MSRSGYDEYYSEEFNNQLEFYRNRVEYSIKGKRGQNFLKFILEEMDRMPVKKLIKYEFQEGDNVCALGVVGRARGIDMSEWDTEDNDNVAEKAASTFNISDPMAREIMWLNDEAGHFNETPELRFCRVREWVVSNIKRDPSDT